jgi:two-component system, chemotaxis family, chemotaxis protein CheY
MDARGCRSTCDGARGADSAGAAAFYGRPFGAFDPERCCAAMPAMPSNDPRYNFSAMSVLIVEDNAFARKLVRDICRTFRFGEILVAESPQEALATLEGKRVDFIVSDWDFGPQSKMDGLDLTRHIRRDPSSSDPYVPIVMLTAHADIAHVTRARDAGVTEFLAKPISPVLLLARLTHVIDHPRPFIRHGDYFGPDRRRRAMPFEGPERRVGAPADASLDETAPDAGLGAGQRQNLSAADVAKILPEATNAKAGSNPGIGATP